MIEYFIFILMIIVGVAIIAFAVDKKRRRGGKDYAGISSKGSVTRGRASRYKNRASRDRYASDPENPDKRYDSLFSGKKEDKKDRYRKIMDRRKNIRPGEVEIPVKAWDGSGDRDVSKKSQASGKNGKYGHLFSSDSSASTSKLAKLKKRAMDVYEEQYTKEDVPEKEEKPSIFSMFGRGNAEDSTPPTPTPPPVQSSFEPEMRREEVQPLPERLPERESVPEPVASGFGNFGRSDADVNGNPGMSRVSEDNNPRPPEPQPNNDDAAKDDAFNRMLGFDQKKEQVPKKKNDNEWTPMF